MAVLIDSYSESNQNSYFYLNTSGYSQIGQSFTGNGILLTSCEFYLSESDVLSGTAVARVYAHSGTFGVDSVPTGAPLATSAPFDISTLTGSFQLIPFTFPENILLENGTKYVLAIECVESLTANYILVGSDDDAPTHGGNASLYDAFSETWSSDPADVCFYIYGEFPNTTYAKSNIVVTNLNNNSAKANIVPITQNNSTKADILATGNKNNSVKSSLLLAGTRDNYVAGNIQLSSAATVPDNVKNITIGSPTQPGVTTLYDNNSETFADFMGIVSTTTFQFGYVEVSSQQDTTSGTTVDVTNMSLTFTLDREANVLYFATVSGMNLSVSGAIVLMYLSPTPGTQIGPAMMIPGSLNYVAGSPHDHNVIYANTSSVAFIRQTPAGTNTVKLVYNSSVGGTTARLTTNPRALGYIVLGK